MGRVAKGKHAFQANGLGVERMTITTPTQTSADERTDTHYPVPLAPSSLHSGYFVPQTPLPSQSVIYTTASGKRKVSVLDSGSIMGMNDTPTSVDEWI